MSTTKRPVGRPKLKLQNKKQHFGLYLTPSEYSTLEYIAKEIHGKRSASQFICDLLRLNKGI
ncbi:hypothetical protein K6U27_04625 [Vibrio fluvialis]|uniref:hypothetical protein n=1 Tax=Vibrio fluvialis TaxID=676 RepID=UPI001EEABD31|nr:hypothetical protein [Vibrio fluvialis]MCG6371981.1 hypothetical protein [Vibrio fluvialis]